MKNELRWCKHRDQPAFPTKGYAHGLPVAHILKCLRKMGFELPNRERLHEEMIRYRDNLSSYDPFLTF